MRYFLLCLPFFLFSCASVKTAPPKNIANACNIIDERKAWEDDIFDASKEWRVSPGIILAFIKQESSFRHDARPKDKEGKLLSSAYGYSQALNGTWAQYEKSRGSAKRKKFRDSADFIGWYLDHISKTTGISKTNPKNLYLAYHEGPAGFKRGTYNSKSWLLNVANRVELQAQTYDNQLRDCETRRMKKIDKLVLN